MIGVGKRMIPASLFRRRSRPRCLPRVFLGCARDIRGDRGGRGRVAWAISSPRWTSRCWWLWICARGF